MTVQELIEFLETQPKDMEIVYEIYSEQALLEEDLIGTEELCYPREDGWVHSKRPDKLSKKYLVFPGN